MKKFLYTPLLLVFFLSCDKDIYHPPLTCKITDFALTKSSPERLAYYNSDEIFLAFVNMNSIDYDGAGRPVHGFCSGPDTAAAFQYSSYGALEKFIAYPKPPIITKLFYWKFTLTGLNTISITAGHVVRATDLDVVDGTAELQFDNLHRISKVIYPDGNYVRYDYNNSLNLYRIYKGSSTSPESVFAEFSSYDTKQNFTNTSKVWQLIMNTYSNNNPLLSLFFGKNHDYSYEYNSENLPTKIRDHFVEGSDIETNSVILYSCPATTL
ncbi:MAG: hypothetical protein ACJ75B_17495 [Flavisolibacter sp.]